MPELAADPDRRQHHPRRDRGGGCGRRQRLAWRHLCRLSRGQAARRRGDLQRCRGRARPGRDRRSRLSRRVRHSRRRGRPRHRAHRRRRRYDGARARDSCERGGAGHWAAAPAWLAEMRRPCCNKPRRAGASRRPSGKARFSSFADAPAVWALDSASLVGAEHVGTVVVTGSHGGLLGGRPDTALKYDALAALFNDAGIGIDEAGVTRLPALDARGIAAGTVAAASARIGDARSTYEDGILSRVNSARRSARPRPGNDGAGVRCGHTPRAWLNGGDTHDRCRADQQPTLRPHERRPRARRDAAARRGRADVRDGRVSALAVLRCARAARHAALPDQRRALRRLCRGGLCSGHQPARGLRRDARARRHQPRHRPDRGIERRDPDDRAGRRHQPRAFLEEHDPGMPAGRDIAAGGQGADPGRADEPRARAAAPRLRRGDLRPAGPGIARRPRGCLPRRARFHRRGFRDRPDDVERAGAAHPARPGGHRPRRRADRACQAAADPGRRRHPSLGGLRARCSPLPRRSRSRSPIR